MKNLLCTLLFAFSVFTAHAMIGNTNNGTTTDTMWNASLNAAVPNGTIFQANSNETVSVIYAKIAGMTGRYKCAVYSGTASSATTFLRGTSEIINPTNGWYVFPLTSSLPITNGQYYCIVVWGDASPAAVYFTSGGTTVWKNIAYTANWPNPFAQGGSFSATYCVYAISTVTNPPPVTYPATNKVTLAWDRSPDASVVGYRLYYGIGSRSYTNSVQVGNVTNAMVTNLVASTTYYFGATAFDSSGLESDFSNEAMYTVPTPPTNTPPAMLQNFRFF